MTDIWTIKRGKRQNTEYKPNEILYEESKINFIRSEKKLNKLNFIREIK